MEPVVLGTSDDESGSDSWSDESDAVASEPGNDDETSEDDESDDGLSDDDESDDGSEDGDSEGGDSEDGESEDAEDEDDGSSRRPERKERLYTANDMRAALRLILSHEIAGAQLTPPLVARRTALELYVQPAERRVCGRRRGRARSRKAVARGCGRSVLLPCFVCPRPAHKIAQVAYACTLSSRMCEWSRAPGWIS